MKTIVTIPEKVPSNNGKRGLLRMHWSRRGDLKKKWTRLFLTQPHNIHTGRVKIHFTHYHRGMAIQDAENLSSTSKIPLDALVAAGIITDDKMKVIGTPTFSQVRVKENHQVQTIIEIEDLESE
ncbi:hypothetical protein DR864_00410 [Runella rosea]|uniref:Uncharacterized protein n=1 Tax=Runella rosea TaxID=2259595 RepID=A0A344TC69_9BACT|nr:hypothetical protein [Runella rosea]AXE16240.1 hypothetical protein DR864_00135 [Runella rosea]AXE16295.1 hypothetical protein DR864_00410 [Runella rosea]